MADRDDYNPLLSAPHGRLSRFPRLYQPHRSSIAPMEALRSFSSVDRPPVVECRVIPSAPKDGRFTRSGRTGITGSLSKAQHALSNRLNLAHIPRCPRPDFPQHLKTAERHPDLISCNGQVLPLEESTASGEERQCPLAYHARREGGVVKSANW